MGPIVLLLPLACLFLAASYLIGPSQAELGLRAEPPIHGPTADVAGWRGELRLAGGRHFRATLGPLHSDAEREAFDSEALRARFDLGAGRVFKLVLTELPTAHSKGSQELPLSPRDLVVKDAAGLALSSLTLKRELALGGVADPIQVLLRAPDRQLGSDRSATWILWGRAPDADARVEGFESGESLGLTAKTLPREQVDVALLRRGQ